VKTISLFNNNGGVGKTSLVYHLAWMYADLGLNVLAADLDPQANLTSMFLPEERVEQLWPEDQPRQTIYGAVQPLLDGTGDISPAHVEDIAPNLGLVVGDLLLSASEDELNSQWADCLDRKQRAFRVVSAFWRVIENAASTRNADLVLIDVGPNLGAVNRAALISAEYVVIPLAADLYSLQGLRNLGPTLRRWSDEWKERRERNPVPTLSMPPDTMEAVGYVVMQHAVRLDRPVKAYDRWMGRIPAVYDEAVLNMPTDDAKTVASDDHCLAMLKNYRSLMPLSQEARKPMFLLRSADGAIGGHAQAVQECYRDFRSLALRIAERCDIPIRRD
jgi:chromosome partitioning protein